MMNTNKHETEGKFEYLASSAFLTGLDRLWVQSLESGQEFYYAGARTYHRTQVVVGGGGTGCLFAVHFRGFFDESSIFEPI